MVKRWLVVGGLAVAFAPRCADPTAAEERLVTRVSLDRTTLTPGDTVHATVTVTNGSPLAVVIEGSSTCLIGLAIYREETGELAYPRGQVCTADLMPLRFRPGQSHVRTLIWTAERQEYVYPELFRYPEPPGRYRVLGGLGNAINLTQTSDPVWIDVVAP